MERKVTFIDRIAGTIVATALFVVGLFFMLLGVTLLPVVGVLVGIAITGFSVHFSYMGAPKERRIVSFSQTDALCPWPPTSTTDQISLPAES